MSISTYRGYDIDDEQKDDEFVEEQEQMWERQQKTTFTAWCNSHLRKINESINDITKDFRDGVKLIKLLEVISNEKLPACERGKMRVHKINDVNKALRFIASKGVRLIGISSEEIVDGNTKMTLGMIWTIILRFAIQEITVDDLSAKEGLLLWCQRRTANYKNVNVKNFHTSFKDGLAFCALIHKHRPDLINYSQLSKDNPKHNLDLAFAVADKELDIPPMLDADDMIKSVKPDEHSVVAYISTYYHVFSGVQKAENATTQICKVIEETKQNESMMDAYDKLATDLDKWITQKTHHFENRETPISSTDQANELLKEHRAYVTKEKPPKLEEKGRLETTFNSLQTRLRLSNRPAFLPDDNKRVVQIQRLWRLMERAEKDYADWLVSQKQNLEVCDHLARRLNLKCTTHEAWAEGKEEMLASRDWAEASLGELLAMEKKHVSFGSDLSAHQPRVESINTLLDELKNLNYAKIDSCNKRVSMLCEQWQKINNLNKERANKIQAQVDKLTKVDGLQLEFAQRVASIYNFVEQAKEDLQDDPVFHFVEDVKDAITAHEAYTKCFDEAKQEYNEINALNEEINDLCTIENPYTFVTMQELASQWESLLTLIPQREAFFEAELKHQQKKEDIRIKFAKLANEVGPWLEARHDKVGSLAASEELNLEDQKVQLEQLLEEVHEYRSAEDSPLKALDVLNRELHENNISENSHTTYTMESIQVSADTLFQAIRGAQNEVANQIYIRDSKGITNEQLNEFRSSFNHFDSNNNGTLDPSEFKACLLSLGYSWQEDKTAADSGSLARRSSMGDTELTRILLIVDPENKGFITFDSFLDFMTRETTHDDSAESIIYQFKVLSGDKSYITADEIRRELPPDEAEYCISRMHPVEGAPDPGALDYRAFAASLYGQSDDL